MAASSTRLDVTGRTVFAPSDEAFARLFESLGITQARRNFTSRLSVFRSLNTTALKSFPGTVRLCLLALTGCRDLIHRRPQQSCAPCRQNMFMSLDPDRIADALAYHMTDAKVNIRSASLARVRLQQEYANADRRSSAAARSSYVLCDLLAACPLLVVAPAAGSSRPLRAFFRARSHAAIRP